VDLSGYLDNTDAQDLELSGNTLSLTNDGTTVDLSAYVNTDSQNLTSATLSGTTLTVEIQNGTSVNVDLSPILSALETENTTQQNQINDLLTRVTDLEACACQTLSDGNGNGDVSRNGPALYQNIPNPFNETSSIRYYLPQTVGSANIVFSDTSGKILSNVTLRDRGEQEMIINKQGLSAGMYYYTLYIEGRKFDTKKMIIE
ncbi:MAG: T9SS type A sorting domain-containing protein, partial [Bacteroidota bacterium]